MMTKLALLLRMVFSTIFSRRWPVAVSKRSAIALANGTAFVIELPDDWANYTHEERLESAQWMHSTATNTIDSITAHPDWEKSGGNVSAMRLARLRKVGGQVLESVCAASRPAEDHPE